MLLAISESISQEKWLSNKQKLRLLEQVVHKVTTVLQRLVVTSSKPVMEITKMSSARIYTCVSADCLKNGTLFIT
jgi:hypothetical protein